MYNTNNLDIERYRSKLKCHTTFYKKKIEINPKEIRIKWIKKINKDPDSLIHLGSFRHSKKVCNYDEVIKNIALKWEEKDPIFSRDIIHSVQNSVNSLILKEIFIADRNWRCINVSIKPTNN